MTTTGSDPGLSPDLETIQADLATLKRDLATLVSHLKTGAKEGVGSAAGTVNDEVMRVYENLVAQGERSAKAIGRHVEEQPVTSLLVAFAVGFIGGRMLSR